MCIFGKLYPYRSHTDLKIFALQGLNRLVFALHCWKVMACDSNIGGSGSLISVINLSASFDEQVSSCELPLSEAKNSIADSGSSWLHVKTPSTSGRCFWNLGFGTPPTPMASSTLAIGAAPRQTTLRDTTQLVPIPLSYDCDSELEVQLNHSALTQDNADYPTTPPNDHSGSNELCAVTTPLGHSLRSLNISQTQTPCHSTLDRRAVIKSVDKSYRIKMLSARERRIGAVHRRPVRRPSADLTGPQCNVNPFTPSNGHVLCNSISVEKRIDLCSSGGRYGFK